MGRVRGAAWCALSAAMLLGGSTMLMAASPKAKSDDISDLIDTIADPTGGEKKPAGKPAKTDTKKPGAKGAGKKEATKTDPDFVDVEGPAGAEKTGPATKGGKGGKGAKVRDPIAIAVAKQFELPPQWRLDDKQTEAYNKIKNELEPQYRKALEAMDEARKGKDSSLKRKASKEVVDLKKKIDGEMFQFKSALQQEFMIEFGKKQEEMKKKMEEYRNKRGR